MGEGCGDAGVVTEARDTAGKYTIPFGFLDSTRGLIVAIPRWNGGRETRRFRNRTRYARSATPRLAREASYNRDSCKKFDIIAVFLRGRDVSLPVIITAACLSVSLYIIPMCIGLLIRAKCLVSIIAYARSVRLLGAYLFEDSEHILTYTAATSDEMRSRFDACHESLSHPAISASRGELGHTCGNQMRSRGATHLVSSRLRFCARVSSVPQRVPYHLCF